MRHDSLTPDEDEPWLRALVHAPPLALEPTSGARVGRYVLIAPLGRGGSGTAAEARDADGAGRRLQREWLVPGAEVCCIRSRAARSLRTERQGGAAARSGAMEWAPNPDGGAAARLTVNHARPTLSRGLRRETADALRRSGMSRRRGVQPPLRSIVERAAALLVPPDCSARRRARPSRSRSRRAHLRRDRSIVGGAPRRRRRRGDEDTSAELRRPEPPPLFVHGSPARRS